MPMKQKIVFIGNSIVNGFPFSRGKSFPGLIRAAVKERKPLNSASGDDGDRQKSPSSCDDQKAPSFSAEIINKGENGQTTADISRRFEHDVLDHQPLAVFIMTGTNDFMFKEASPEEAFANMEELAHRAEAAGTVPVYMTPLRVDAELASTAWMVGLGIDYNVVNGQIEEFSRMIRESGRLCVDTNIAYQQYADDAPYRDGVHPTVEGYAFLAEVVLNWIEEHKPDLGLA